MNLKDYQNTIGTYVFSNETNEPQKALKEQLAPYSDEELNARLSVYKNNTFYSLIEAIKDLYPSVVTTVGDELVSATARVFIETHPPHSAAMVDFGQEFPDFLQTFSGTQEFYYLPDLAKLDLARHQSYHALDEIPLNPEVFATLDNDALSNATITPIESAQLLSSNYAIYDIWQLAQNGSNTSINANQRQTVLILRPNADVDTYLIGEGVFDFLSALINEQSIGQALSNSMEKHTDFNPTHAISFLIQSGFVKSIHEART